MKFKEARHEQRNNETTDRITAAIVLLLSVVYVLFPHWSLAAILSLQFFLRGFTEGKYSLFDRLSEYIAEKLRLRQQTANSAAQEFAAQVAFVVSDFLFILSFLGLLTASLYVAGVIICFSALEAFTGFSPIGYLYALYQNSRLAR